jgi:catechol 2,3-dioxygenase-like lactoylglutathione lyase family enzyme
MLTIGGFVMGVDDIPRATAFWSAALGYVVSPADSYPRWTTLRPPRGTTGTPLYLQLSDTPVQEKPRLHLDLDVPDLAAQRAEADRLVALGARRVDWDSYPDDPDFVVLADTEGNLFCIVDQGHVPAGGTADQPG